MFSCKIVVMIFMIQLWKLHGGITDRFVEGIIVEFRRQTNTWEIICI